jgi:catechol 2,3-dioxygenase-like lactoylglutathione lyase family enzyme
VIRLAYIDHVGLAVSDLDAAAGRWCRQFGLVERSRVDGRARLACDDEPYCLELSEAGDRPAGIDHVAWELHADCGLDVARAHLERLGVEVDDDPQGGLTCRDPDGNRIQLLPARGRSGVDRYVQHARPAAGVPGAPRKLGHVNFLTGSITEQTRFYTEALGMKVSDRLDDAGVWLRIDSEHHVMALVDMGSAHPHHLAFEYVDFGHKIPALDHLARHGRWLGWGPVRHGIAGNIASYVRIVEEECFVELFCDMERVPDDHEPRTYPDDRFSSNTWGPLPPRSYFRFDEAAIESERESLETRGVPLPPLES